MLVAAGGTGGHLFPAEALAAALKAARHRGASGDRPARRALWRRLYRRDYSCRRQRYAARAQSDRLDANRRRSASVSFRLGSDRTAAARAVIGFGGYPTIPPVLAATWRGVPSLVHDANAVIGRANRLLAPRVDAIATTFPDMFSTAPDLAAKATLTGNPVRAAVVAAAATPYSEPNDPLRLVVFGGSQGARVMADIVPAAIGQLDAGLRARLRVVQQAREEDMGRVRAGLRERCRAR